MYKSDSQGSSFLPKVSKHLDQTIDPIPLTLVAAPRNRLAWQELQFGNTLQVLHLFTFLVLNYIKRLLKS